MLNKPITRTSQFMLAAICCLWIHSVAAEPPSDSPYLVVLGTAQDAGYPHTGCRRDCCKPAWTNPALREPVTCLALVDPVTGQRWMFEATPDFPHQLEKLNQLTVSSDQDAAKQPDLSGIFLTHAHIGHYSGLMYLGRESLGARDVPVFAMPRMRDFLRDNGPWSQLLALQNIELRPLVNHNETKLNDRLAVTPILVPHRDEFSETVGFIIKGPKHSALFLPDINKWEAWEKRSADEGGKKIENVIATVDFAFLDATFFDGKELPNRDMAEIPHPFIVESMDRFQSLPESERNKIRFIHLNHTNPALRKDSPATKTILENGLHVARTGSCVEL